MKTFGIDVSETFVCNHCDKLLYTKNRLKDHHVFSHDKLSDCKYLTLVKLLEFEEQ